MAEEQFGDLYSDPGLPECGELEREWRGREVNAFDRYLGDKRDGNCGLELEWEREDIV